MSDPIFIETQEHRRFAEFCDACRRYRYIGLCYGAPGVGKTVSAETYSAWRQLQTLADLTRTVMPATVDAFAHHALLYTVPVTVSPGQLARDISDLRSQLNYVLVSTRMVQADQAWWRLVEHDLVELIIIDEADRLAAAPLEQVRDVYDRSHLGVVLIGMPGIERRLARYPQLYSRIGFVHHFRPLSVAEMRQVVPRLWQEMGHENEPLAEDVLLPIMRITGGNFRLIQRLLSQMERIMAINRLPVATKEAVETARISLIIGAT
jgi:DNA transposition AAA+ family ATPase